MYDNDLACNCAVSPHSKIAKRPGTENWVAEGDKSQSVQDPNPGRKVNYRGSLRGMQVVSELMLEEIKAPNDEERE